MTTSPVQPKPLEFIDLDAQQKALGEDLRAAMSRVLDHGRYILGPEVADLEEALAAFCGAEHAVTCANGTDALLLALSAMGLASGDAVICPSFTFCATAEAVAYLGGVPVFADIDSATFNLEAASVQDALKIARAQGLAVKGLIAVDLFGLPADYDTLEEIAEAESLWVIADAAQSFGGRRNERPVGTMGSITTTSFFPAKPLGCYGDGGALFTQDAACASFLRSMRVHGSGEHKYDNVHIGMNSRLDTLQAAVLTVKLAVYAEELQRRQTVAARYQQALAATVRVPHLPEGSASSWAQYTVTLPVGSERAAVQARLKDQGVPTAIYYARPLHLQTAYRDFPASDCATSEDLAGRVLSLPMHPYLEPADQNRVIEAVRDALA